MERVDTNAIKDNSRWNLFKDNIKTVYQYPWQKITNQDIPIHKKIGFGFLGVAEIIGIGITATIAGCFAVFNKPLSQHNANSTNLDECTKHTTQTQYDDVYNFINSLSTTDFNDITAEQFDTKLGNNLSYLKDNQFYQSLSLTQFTIIISKIYHIANLNYPRGAPLELCHDKTPIFNQFIDIYNAIQMAYIHLTTSLTNENDQTQLRSLLDLLDHLQNAIYNNSMPQYNSIYNDLFKPTNIVDRNTSPAINNKIIITALQDETFYKPLTTQHLEKVIQYTIINSYDLTDLEKTTIFTLITNKAKELSNSTNDCEIIQTITILLEISNNKWIYKKQISNRNMTYKTKQNDNQSNQEEDKDKFNNTISDLNTNLLGEKLTDELLSYLKQAELYSKLNKQQLKLLANYIKSAKNKIPEDDFQCIILNLQKRFYEIITQNNI